MTDAELQGIALQALNMVKRDVEQKGRGWLLASYHHGEGIHRMAKVEALIDERLGPGWLDNGRAKDIGFGLLRLAVQMSTPDAVVFVTATDIFKTTPAFHELAPEKQQEIMNAGHDRHHQAVREGFLVLQDSFTAVAQTAARVCVYNQAADHNRFVGPPEVEFIEQREFSGRLKMFGEKPPLELWRKNA